MQNTIDSQRERSQKKKARALKKKLRQQKTKSIADQEHQSDVEAEALPLKDPKPKQQIQYKKGELAIIVDNLENHYFDLVGNGKSADYKQRRDKAWSRLIDSLNEWNESEGYPVVREYDSVKRKIDNLKQRGNSTLLADWQLSVVFEIYLQLFLNLTMLQTLTLMPQFKIQFSLAAQGPTCTLRLEMSCLRCILEIWSTANH